MPSRTDGNYPSDLTDAQWNLIRHLFPKAKPGGRPRTTNIREVINAVFFINRTGCAWRYLPGDFPPWKTVHRYFISFRALGIWKRVHDLLVKRLRGLSKKSKIPSCAIIDSQAVKASYGEQRGYDGFKGIRGRKRHVMVDTLGMIHSLRIHAANLADCQQGHTLYERCSKKALSNLRVVYADRGYLGTFVEQTKYILGFAPTLPPPNPNSGQGKPKKCKDKLANRKLRGLAKNRWIVERTFAWLNNYRRLARDYERNVQNSVAMVHLAMTQLILRRIAPLEKIS